MSSKKWGGKKVAVLMGGVSKEREISLRSGTAIAGALRRRGYDVIEIDVKGGMELVSQIKSVRPNVAVVALHGKFGEDGCIQGLLEMLRLPYTGGGVLASSVAMDKVTCNRIARGLGIVCPDEVFFDVATDDAERFIADLSLSVPLIVKPSREGSTINITIVRAPEGIPEAIRLAAQSDNKIVVQKYIQGQEVTVGILNGRALSPLEIVPKSGFYDYASKYTKGMTEYIVPARIKEDVAARISEWSVAICNAIECEGTARADFMVEDSDAYFLEVNTIPGMTELSLVPKAAAHLGLSFEDVCEELLYGARLKVEV